MIYHAKSGYRRVAHETVREKMVLSPSEEEVRRLFDVVRGDRTREGRDAYKLFRVLANLGPRIAEALRLGASNFTYLDSYHAYTMEVQKKKGGLQTLSFPVSEGEEAMLHRLLLEETYTQERRLFWFGVRRAQYLFSHYVAAARVRPILSPHAMRRFMSAQITAYTGDHFLSKLRLGHELSKGDATLGYNIHAYTPEFQRKKLGMKPVYE